MDAIKVLHIENDHRDAEVVSRLLSRSSQSTFDTTVCDTIESGAVAMGVERFDVLLLDRDVSGVRGFESLITLRRLDQRLPIVMVTDLNDEAVALQSLHYGAQDYLIKSFLTTDGLIRAIQHAMQRQALLLTLSQAKALLEKKNRRLARLNRLAHRFVDNVSHEFRTPLTVIKEYVSLIGEGVVGHITEEQCRMLHVVEERADDLNTMVDDMLDSSKVEAGLLAMRRRACTVTEIVQGVWPALERKAAVREISLKFELEDGLEEVFCDPEKVGRVLINLISNALKFCGEDGKVRLSVRRDTTADGAVFSVIDNGPGISAENQEVIFRRFKQVNTPVRGSTKGFGLGLAIAKDLVGLNLGEITLDSRLGEGCNFSFNLPLADPAIVLSRYLRRGERLQRGKQHVVFVEATIENSAAEALSDEMGEFLGYLLRPSDLLFRAARSRWLVVLAAAECDTATFCKRAGKELAEADRNRFGGPLPPLSLRPVGAWTVGGNQAEILSALRVNIANKETTCV